MTDYKQTPMSIVVELAQFIREVDGNNSMGAGSLAEKICERFRVVTPNEQMVVGWQFYQDGKWWYGDDRIKVHRKNTEAAGIPVRDVYATPQPAEQEPDVSTLIEALESAKNLIANHSGEVLPDEYAGDQIEQIDTALAAYRKQGDEA